MSDPVDVGLLDAATAASRAPEIVGDAAIVQAMTDVEAALLAALTGRATSLRAPAPADLAVEALGGGNPVLPLLDRLRAQLPEDEAALLHLGATSQDVVDSALMLVALRARVAVSSDLRTVATALARLAEAHRRTPVAARTLGQQAAPTVFGLRAAVLLDGVVRTADRLQTVEPTLQLGGSVGTLAVLVDRLGEERAAGVRDEVARTLGLAAPRGVWHVERSVVGDLAGALAGLIGALGRIGVEVVQGARTEIGELVLTSGGGSSAMPQKRNPVAAALLVANARRAPALASTVLAAALAVDDRPPGDWHAEHQPLRELLRLAIESAALAARAVGALEVDAERMRANLALTRGAVHAERVGQVLAEALGPEEGHRIVREALGAEDFVPAVLAAIDVPSLGERVRDAASVDGPIGLSDRLIDTALARAARWTA